MVDTIDITITDPPIVELTLTNNVTTIPITIADPTVIEITLSTGVPGPGVASGGTVGQVLRKQSSTNYDTGWETLTKSDINLENVENTADMDKPVSNAQAVAISNAKDEAILTASIDASTKAAAAQAASDPLGSAAIVQANLANHLIDYANPHTVTKAQVNLGNCDNTSDLNKPISIATQAALDLKTDDSSLATVAKSGSYDDLSDKPTLMGETFETVCQNLKSYNVTATTYSASQITKTYSSGAIVTINFSGGLPTTKVLSGVLPAGIATTCTYDFSGGRVIPLKTYS